MLLDQIIEVEDAIDSVADNLLYRETQLDVGDLFHAMRSEWAAFAARLEAELAA